MDDLQFTPDEDMRDLGGATLLIGVRDNDLKGRHATDLTQLPLVHGDPKAQREHCMRDDLQDEPGGSQAALLACRAFIREKVREALGGLDASGKPDPARRTSLPLYLALRHRVDAVLPTYYVSMGQAIHAMEDAFTHTFRTPDSTQVTVVMNWVDFVNGGHLESRDGPAHASELDNCDDLDDLRTRRRELATEVATDMLRVTLDPSKTNAERMAAMETLLDRYIGDSPGCTFDNNWCDAVERKYGNVTLLGTALGCTLGGHGHESSALLWGVVIGLLALPRRPWRRRVRPSAGAGIALFLLGALMADGAAAAPGDTSSNAPAPADEHAPPPPVTTAVTEPGPRDPSQTAFGGYLGGAGSVANGAVASAVGLRLRFNKNWSFGLDGEWNPFVTVNPSRLRAGLFNGYAAIILRMPLAYERFNLRTTLNLGVSRILMDLYGVPKGTTGVYGGLSPLGLEWKMNRTFFLIVNPLNVAMPIPQLKGVPYAYPQYRFTIGLEFYAG